MTTNRAATIVSALTLTFALGGLTPAEAQRGGQKPRRAAAARSKAPVALPCGNIVAFQVLLDRQGFSTGQIGAAANVNTGRALAAFQTSRQIAASGKPDCDTWSGLNGDTADPTVVDYEISVEDASGPFSATIPARLEQQADLPALEYRSVLERLSERFHSAPALLSSMNRDTKFSAGQHIKVPAVLVFDPDVKPEKDAEAGEITISVSRVDSSLRATRRDGTLIFFAPVTSGSKHDPLPVGDWKVEGVAWRPVYHYSPNLFWDANPNDQKATLKPGPNNPVGLIWIDLNIDHYGLHGTPEPGRVGVAQSHGCVRLTNWDVARVAALVKPGTKVEFR
ncbi:MAG: L,D-transpeptidase [Acidobacteriota bacterium]